MTESLRDAKRNPEVLMLGLGPYLDGVTATAADHAFTLHATLSEPAFDDLLARLGGLLALMHGGGPSPASRDNCDGNPGRVPKPSRDELGPARPSLAHAIPFVTFIARRRGTCGSR